MFGQLAAFGIHAFTAIGAVLGFLALIEAAAHRWEAAFAWLGVALVVDGLDGPLARRFQISKTLPRFSGERLDLIIDYLTYVVVPAFLIHEAGLMPAGLDVAAAAIILMSSLFHFIDRDSKTDDGFFVGFPAIWNVVALYLFLFPLAPPFAFAIIAGLGILTFFPTKWVHPIRVEMLRLITICVMAGWSATVVAVLLHGFPARPVEQIVIGAASLYLFSVGLVRTLKARQDAAASRN